MKNLAVGIFFLLATSSLFAQTEEDGSGSKITEYKINYLNKKIMLTPEQAKQFWPVYTDFDKERREIRVSIRDIKRVENKNPTDEQSKENLKIMADLKQKEAGLEKKYLDRFLKVVGPQQVREMQKGERDFNREMIKIIQERRDAREQQLHQHREKSTEHQQNNREKSTENIREHRQNMREVKPKH